MIAKVFFDLLSWLLLSVIVGLLWGKFVSACEDPSSDSVPPGTQVGVAIRSEDAAAGTPAPIERHVATNL